MDIIHADAFNMPLQDYSVDAIVTDPPYGLEFMGKEWDRLDYGLPQESVWKGRRGKGGSDSSRESGGDFNDRIGINYGAKKHASKRCKMCGHYQFSGTPCKCEKPEWEYIYKQEAPSSMIRMQRWHTQWLTEAYRVLKPGGSMLVMGGTRTFHRLMCAIEDSGFIIKDTLMWIYGSGFPKCQEASTLADAKILGISTKEVNKRRKKIGRNKYASRRPNPMNGNSYIMNETKWDCTKGLDITLPLTSEGEHWNGFKVGGIKPAYEPIVWAVKPPEGSYVDNVLKWGVGAVNVDECRVGTDGKIPFGSPTPPYADKRTWNTSKTPAIERESHPKGRFPANIILDEKSAKVMDEQSGDRKTGGCPRKTLQSSTGIYGMGDKIPEGASFAGDSGGASRYFKVVDLDDFSMYNKVLWKYNINGNISGNLKVAGMLNGVIKGIEKSIHNAEHFGYGNSITESSPKDLKLIISILIRQMIELKILLSCLNENTKSYMEDSEKTINSLMELNIEDAKSAKNTNAYRNSLKEKLEHIKAIVKTVKENLCENGKETTESILTPICESIASENNPSLLNQNNHKPITRFLYCAKTSRSERNAGLEGMEEKEVGHNRFDKRAKCGGYIFQNPDRNSACKCKEPQREHNKIKGNVHPTVKPIKLFEWLIKLVTREGQTVLDPFLGSGTTAISAHNTGRRCIGIEKEGEYTEIAKRRVEYHESQPRQMEIGG